MGMKRPSDIPQELREEAIRFFAKAVVAAAFRSGELENLHAGTCCPVCHNQPEYSHISQEQMRLLMKDAVNRIYTLMLWEDTGKIERLAPILMFHAGMTTKWDEPELMPEGF